MSDDAEELITRQPWDQLPDEPVKAYAAFGVFRDIGSRRSIAEAYRIWSGKQEIRAKGINYGGRFVGWCRKFNWQDRAEAFDLHLEKERIDAMKMAARKAAERHAALAEGMQKLVYERLKTIKPGKLSPSNMAHLLDVSTKVERTALGMHSEKTQVEVKAKVDVDNPYADLTDDEFEELEAVAARIRSRKTDS